MDDHTHPNSHDYIDIYCERLEPGLWAEPLNAVTNLAFLVAAGFAFVLAGREGALKLGPIVLATLIFLIGIGSGLFHTFATRWAMIADVLPIFLFQIAFLMLYARNVIKLALWQVGLLLLAFFITIYGFGKLPREWLNGSLSYGPALIFVTGLGLYHWLSAQRERYVLLIAAGIFTLSLTFRSIDEALCMYLPFGTHFMWHVLNAVVLYCTARGYIMGLRSRS